MFEQSTVFNKMIREVARREYSASRSTRYSASEGDMVALVRRSEGDTAALAGHAKEMQSQWSDAVKEMQMLSPDARRRYSRASRTREGDADALVRRGEREISTVVVGQR